jgi:stage V sporulation protein S
MGTPVSDDVIVEVDNTEETVLRVSNTSNPQSVASALSHAVYDGRRVTLRAIGAASVNQAFKACAIARGFVAPRGIDLSIRPGFTTVEMADGQSLSAMTMTVIVTR